MDALLFNKNIQFIEARNPGFLSAKKINIDLVNQKYNNSNNDAEISYWDEMEHKTVHLPMQLIRSEKISAWVEEKIGSIDEEGDIEHFINIDYDVTMWKFAQKIREKLKIMNIDPDRTITSMGSGGTSILALGTGSGQLLERMIKSCKPYMVHVMLSDWHDYVSSFYHIDWEELTNSLYLQGCEVKVGCVKDEAEFITRLRQEGLFYLDHAYIFCAPSTDQKLLQWSQALQGPKIQNLVHYLGYTLDEYNMIVQASDTLKQEPKIYSNPIEQIKGKFIVCGSGPSLDTSIEVIRELQDSHIIVCGGSSYKALVDAGIRVDFLTLMERDYDVGNDDYAGYHESIGGCPDSVHLVMASVCYYKMLSSFPKACVYFRGALTAFPLFSNSERQAVYFEGPEAVNTAIAICTQLGASDITLFGVDLGSVSNDNARSKKVLGNSNRIFDEKAEGNLRDEVYTCTTMLNVKQVLEILVFACDDREEYDETQVYKAPKFVNCSDGIKIKGMQSSSAKDYLNSIDEKINAKSNRLEMKDINPRLDTWWENLDVYTRENLWAEWRRKDPRNNTFITCRQLEELFSSESAWFPETLKAVEKIFDMEASMAEQIPMRIMRGTVLKAVLAVTQQLQIMRWSSSDKIDEFLSFARNLLKDTVLTLEEQIYKVLDYVETND